MWYKIVVIIIFCIICSVLVVAHKANIGHVKLKVDEKQLKESSTIRENTNKGFEKNANEKVSEGKGVIVQPGWTQAVNKVNAPNKVVITQQNLKESAAIREEIQNAVNTGKYVNGNLGFNTSQADHYLGLKFRSKNVLSNMVGTEKDKFEKEVVGNTFDEETETKSTNIIESLALDDDIDIERLKQLELSSRRTREILVVKEIIEDLSFELGEDIKAWKHLLYDGRDYYIGLRDTDLLIVQKDAMKYEKGYTFNVESPILYFETFHYWNTDSEMQEGIIIIAFNEKLIWYQVHSTNVFWEWFIGIPTTIVLYFKIGNMDYIALSSDQSSRSGFSSLNIYQFDLKSKEFWMAQKLQLEGQCIDVAFLDTGRDTVLAVVQNNSASIFTFNPYSENRSHIKFEHKNTIPSEGIQSVAGFRMGGYSYIAVGGLSPKILHYSQGEFVPKTILGQNFGLVEMFLPIPARTYRDDMFLLVQHRVDFESHALVVLETLIWDGNVFDTVAPAPCIIGNYTFSHDISCLLDVQRESGIKGSAILKKDDNVFIIVPRDKAESGLFEIKTELLAKNSELMDLKDIFSFLTEWVNEHDQLINDAIYYFKNYETSQANGTENYNAIRASELYFNGEIGAIYLNEYEWTEDDIHVDLEDLIGEIERMDINLGAESEMIRNRRELTYDTLDFENMETGNLVFQLLNGEKSYLTNTSLIFNSTISFDALWVMEEIRLSAARTIRNSGTQLNNLEFGEINDIKWTDILDDVIFRNNHFQIDELDLVGEIVAEGNTNVYAINGLTFPDNLLWSSGPQASIVHAKKNFGSTLTAHAVDTGGLLNKINPFDIISLTEMQNISGLTTFTQLEVSERMHVNGTVQGRGLTKFLSNPTLLESNIIHSACTFQQLEVSGPILISEKYNGITLDKLLNDIVYLETITNEFSIHSHKHFDLIDFREPLNLYRHNLNHISLNTFITKNTVQNFDIRNISGNVYFNNISLNGQYDAVYIRSLIDESIQTDIEVIFNENVQFNNICWAKTIQLYKTLNGIKDYSELRLDLNIEHVEFEILFAANLITSCNIIGAGNIQAEPLNPVPVNRNMNVFVAELILKSSLETSMINSIHSDLFIAFLEHLEDIPTMIWKEKIIVKSIHTAGDVQVMKLNDQNFDDDIQLSTIWLNRPNYLHTSLMFEEIIIANGDLLLTKILNKRNVSNTIKDIIFKSDPFIVKVDKEFSNIMYVIESSQIESINNIPFMEIATKQVIERFRGNVYLNNTLSSNNLNIPHIVNGHFNNFGFFFRFDEKINKLVIFSEVKFNKYLNFESLHVHGKLNSIRNVNDFFENLVYTNSICMLKGKITFKNNVSIKRGAYIRNLNGYNMAHLIKNVIFINHPDPFLISASVIFQEPVQVKDITIKGSLFTSNLRNCFLEGWMQDTLRINKPNDIGGVLQFPLGVINNNSFQIVFINKLDLEFVVPLQLSQNVSNYMSFSDIYLSKYINSDMVNGIYLQTEVDNTLKVNGYAHITSPLIMNSCDVAFSFCSRKIGQHLIHLNNTVKFSDGLEINFPLFFLKINTNRVISMSNITGRDITMWHRNSFISQAHQNMVTSDWIILSLQTAYANVDRYIENIDKQKYIKESQNMQLHQSFREVCRMSTQLVRNLKNRIRFVKYIEKSFTIVEQDVIAKVFVGGDSSRSYLIINVKCQIKIFVWNTAEGLYVILDQFNSGMVEEILTFPAENQRFYLVTKTEKPIEECTFMGLNVWYFDQQKMIHLKSFAYSDISMIYPSPKNTNVFYAISKNMGKILRLSTNSSEEEAWDLPINVNESYRFLPHDADLGVALTNGHHILLLNSPPSEQSLRKRRSSIPFKSNTEYTKAYLFGESTKLRTLDSFQALESILLELITSLNIQLLDAQHIVSSKNLSNDDMYMDFTTLMERISNEEFLEITPLRFNKTALMNNPVIVLVTRIVKIILPVFKQIEDVKKIVHLEDKNASRICQNISRSLISAVTDILSMAINSAEIYSQNKTFAATISRVKILQKEVYDVIYKVKVHLLNIIPVESNYEMASELSMQYLQLSPNVTNSNPFDEPFIAQSILENNFLVANSPRLPIRGEGEIISIKTGVSESIRTLIVTMDTPDKSVETELSILKIYFDVVTGSLFQTLSAYRPTCLCAFHIKNHSFLVFVEGEQIIRIMIYKGIRGFVDYLKFEVYEPVYGLNYVSVAAKTGSDCLKHFLIVNSRKNINFYEIVLTGNCNSEAKEKDC